MPNYHSKMKSPVLWQVSVCAAAFFLMGCAKGSYSEYQTQADSAAAVWQPAGEKIRTDWVGQIDPTCPLAEYPRPQMQRNDWMNLNGMWQYAITDRTGEDVNPTDIEQPTSWDGMILVPYPIESSLSGVGKQLSDSQDLWYHRTIQIPRAWRKKHIMLNFGAVDWKAWVYINGQLAGEHTGGYAPFSIDMTPYLTEQGEQHIALRVYDPTDKGYQPVGKQTFNPRSIWYTAVSGIWQTVWMEPVADQYITAVVPIPDIDKQQMHVRVSTNEEPADEAYIRIKLLEQGTVIADVCGKANEDIVVDVETPILWSPESPFLYTLSVSIEQKSFFGKKVTDRVESYAAMRKISVAKDDKGIVRMQLNNATYFQYGPLDQGWWPDGLYTAPTDEALCYDIQKTKDLGFNMIRKHVKVEPARWYYHCDRLGILVWQDMPSGDRGNEWAPTIYGGGTDRERSTASLENYYHEWNEIMQFCMPYPCVVVWVPFNEAWGQFETEKVAEWTRNRDNSRLVNPASGGNFRDCGDIMDLHHYPEPAMYLFDSTRVNVLGEYGGIGLPLEGHLWWERNWGYVQFHNSEEVTNEYINFTMILKDLVEKGFSAAVYTQTTDVEGEVNGLMTYDRAVLKVNEEKVRNANQAVILHGSTTCSGLHADLFKDSVNGAETALYTLKNTAGMEVCITNYGGRIVSILVPDKNGKMQDVVLGFGNIKDYETIPSDFGACIGRYANRIKNGKITIDGTTYTLQTNNFGHTLHGGPTGWQNKVYQAEQLDDHTLRLTIVSEDGDNGFPGQVTAECLYTLDDENTLHIAYSATTDAPTVINMTNHSYFNLTGNGNENILAHELWLNANKMTPVDETFMTTGEIADIAQGDAFDFYTAPKMVGKDIEADNAQLHNGKGYDHNWVLQPKETKQGLNLAATLYCAATGIQLDVLTDEPGIQVYTGNFLDGTVKGKRGEVYGLRNAICLETQKYPDTPNKPTWPSAILRPGEKYESHTDFRFSVK